MAETLPVQCEVLGAYRNSVSDAIATLTGSGFAKGLWARDPSIWSADTGVQKAIANRLGWLGVVDAMQTRAAELEQFAREVKDAGFRWVVLLGMGGSSLSAAVCGRTFPVAGYPELLVLDTISPEMIRAVCDRVDLSRTLFISASKSGVTIETDTLTEYFFAELGEVVEQPGQQFVAITDPGSPLVRYAAERGFLRVFENPVDVGGRYSALSYFGLVPMALIGVDLSRLLGRAQALAASSRSALLAREDPSVRLGAVLGALAKEGRDKLTLIVAPPIESFALWIEQLIAGSTGKQGKGIIPVVESAVLEPSAYGKDRAVVAIGVGGIPGEDKLGALERVGTPVIRIQLNDTYDLGAEFLRWEIATAAAGTVLGVNPFDEPNVTESKKNTSMLLQEYQVTGRLTAPESLLNTELVRVAISSAMPREIDAEAEAPGDIFRILFSAPCDGEYIGVLAYLPPTAAVAETISRFCQALGKLSQRAVTVGYGPGYLHSTGQLHKGGDNKGIFFMFTADSKEDVGIPQRPFTFGTLLQAQALGDFRSLDGHGRRAMLVHIKGGIETALEKAMMTFLPK